jgi:4-alpha-glucanotransferase
MNKPGTTGGNWRWRLRLDQFHNDLVGRLADLTTLYNRVPKE